MYSIPAEKKKWLGTDSARKRAPSTITVFATPPTERSPIFGNFA